TTTIIVLIPRSGAEPRRPRVSTTYVGTTASPAHFCGCVCRCPGASRADTAPYPLASPTRAKSQPSHRSPCPLSSQMPMVYRSIDAPSHSRSDPESSLNFRVNRREPVGEGDIVSTGNAEIHFLDLPCHFTWRRHANGNAIYRHYRRHLRVRP